MPMHAVFQGLPPDTYRELARRSRLVPLKKDDILATAGDICTDAYLVRTGQLRVDSGEPGPATAPTGFLVGMDFYVENVLAPSYELQNTLVAVLPSAVQAFPLGIFEEVLRRHPTVLMQMEDLANIRVQALRNQLRRMTTQKSEVIIGRALYELSDPNDDGKRVLSKRVTQAALASYVGMSREQVNKKVKELESKGLIRRVEDGLELDSAFADTLTLAALNEGHMGVAALIEEPPGKPSIR